MKILNPSKLLKILFNLILFVVISNNCWAWDGYDIESNSSIEITDGNLVREGQIIKIFDWQDNANHFITILSMDSDFNGLKIKAQDDVTKEVRIFRMENKHY
jgi:hypothetical protein